MAIFHCYVSSPEGIKLVNLQAKGVVVVLAAVNKIPAQNSRFEHADQTDIPYTQKWGVKASHPTSVMW